MFGMEKQDIDPAMEKNLVTGMIVSKKFMNHVGTTIDLSLLKIPYVKMVAIWCRDYFNVYSDAPGKMIEGIFDQARYKIAPEESTLIESFLHNLSADYENIKAYNEDFAIDSAVKYIKKRSIEVTCKNALTLIDSGRIDQAEEQFSNFKSLSKSTTKFYNPLETKYILEAFEGNESRPINFPDKLGEFLGGFDFGWSVMLAGGYKKGKTWWAEEFLIMSMFQGYPCVYVSLEMTEKDFNERIYKRLTGYGKGGGSFVFPCFDCKKNQDNSCEMSERTNMLPLVNESGDRPEYDPENPYRPCVYCRTNCLPMFSLDTWFEVYQRPAWTFDNVRETVREVGGMFGDNLLRAVCYPRFGASLEEIDSDLDVLAWNQNFIPKVIVIDYPEITKCKDPSDWKTINELWMKVGGMAFKRKALIVAPSQITSNALYATSIAQDNTAGARAKLGHINVGLTINQTKEEKRRGVARIAKLVHRHDDFDEDEQCAVLQQLGLGQIELDSEMVR
jgi:hypothetical protein